MDASRSGMSKHLLIPVDFSDSSMLAIRVGFHFARVLEVNPVILHVYPSAWYGESIDEEYLGVYDPTDEIMREAMENRDILRIAEHRFKKFRANVNQMQQRGELPDIRYSSLLRQGVAEEEILEYCRENDPKLVVMSTRGINKKEEELIGSVAAEVLDSCQVPVFTIPDNYSQEDMMHLGRFLMFCTLEQYDVLGLENMMKTFDSPEADVWLMPITHRNMIEAKAQLEQLYDKLCKAWPNIQFHQALLEESKINDQIDDFIKENKIDLVIAPNRKAGIFTRLFRPSVAHQCLFALDLPMLALPVSKD